jgi:hypothetical protein
MYQCPIFIHLSPHSLCKLCYLWPILILLCNQSCYLSRFFLSTFTIECSYSFPFLPWSKYYPQRSVPKHPQSVFFLTVLLMGINTVFQQIIHFFFISVLPFFLIFMCFLFFLVQKQKLFWKFCNVPLIMHVVIIAPSRSWLVWRLYISLFSPFLKEFKISLFSFFFCLSVSSAHIRVV